MRKNINKIYYLSYPESQRQSAEIFKNELERIEYTTILTYYDLVPERNPKEVIASNSIDSVIAVLYGSDIHNVCSDLISARKSGKPIYAICDKERRKNTLVKQSASEIFDTYIGFIEKMNNPEY